MSRTILAGFIAGFIAVLVFHQGVAFVVHNLGNALPWWVNLFGRAPAPFNVTPVPPFGVPMLLSQAFWGGIWGILMAALLQRTAMPALLTGFLFGALALTLVAFTLVATLKGQPLFAGGNRQIWLRAGLYNGAWGLGAAMLLRRPLRLRN